MDEVVDSLTRKHLGAALVVKDRTLLGIITEGDVRELMQAYITLRSRRIRNGGNNGAPGLSRGA